MPFEPILTEEHYQVMKNSLDQLAVLDMHIQQAKRAGIDVTEQERQMNDTRNKLLQMKNVYFPNR
jgi:phosphoglycerate dehydrogenase-like enzyme